MNIHLGIIPDGNRRWARLNGLPEFLGYIYGARKMEKFLNWCMDLNINKVTAYILSKENVEKRNKKELYIITKLFDRYLKKWIKKDIFEKREIKVNFIGDLSFLPRKTLDKIKELSERTKDYKKYEFNFLINYSGYYEIIKLFEKLKNYDKIDEKIIKENLLIKDDIDLIIRTGKFSRLSNFAPLQSSYSEIYVLDKYWPDIDKEDLINAINWFINQKRNFGK